MRACTSPARFPSTRSVAVGAAYVTVAPDGLVALTVMFAVGAIAGGVVSRTVTGNVAGVALLPAASCALHVTVVVPSANVEPEAGAQVSVICAGASSGSFAVTV